MEDFNDISYHDFIPPQQQKKVYKLSHLWKIWIRNERDNERDNELFIGERYYESFQGARQAASVPLYRTFKVIAVTRGDATECYEGEGLSD